MVFYEPPPHHDDRTRARGYWEWLWVLPGFVCLVLAFIVLTAIATGWEKPHLVLMWLVSP